MSMIADITWQLNLIAISDQLTTIFCYRFSPRLLNFLCFFETRSTDLNFNFPVTPLADAVVDDAVVDDAVVDDAAAVVEDAVVIDAAAAVVVDVTVVGATVVVVCAKVTIL